MRSSLVGHGPSPQASYQRAEVEDFTQEVQSGKRTQMSWEAGRIYCLRPLLVSSD